MHTQYMSQRPLPPITFDPDSLTSFGPPPNDDSERPQPDVGIARKTSLQISSLLHSFRTAIKKTELENPSGDVSKGGQLPGEAEGGGYENEQHLSVKPSVVGVHVIWASDKTCYHCYDCSLKFNFFNRRHHCRFCGRIFCRNCSRFRIPGMPFGRQECLRSCEPCYRYTLKVLLENYATSIPEGTLQHLKSLYLSIGCERESNSYSQSPIMEDENDYHSSPSARTNKRAMSLSNLPEKEELEDGGKRRQSSKALLSPILNSRATRRKPIDFDEYDEVEWPIRKETMVPALGTSSTPLRLNHKEEIAPRLSNDSLFQSKQLPVKANTNDNKDIGQNITLKFDDSIVKSLKRLQNIDERRLELINSIYRPTDVELVLRRLYKTHAVKICNHLLSYYGLNRDKWQKNLLQTVYQVMKNVNPCCHEYSDHLDIRNCVKIKKIYEPTASAHFEYVDGIVFSKCLSHRKMPRQIHNPQVLLLENGLDFDRESDQLTTLDVIVNQESEQMNRYVSQIASVKPSVILCGGSIPLLASNELLSRNIASASNVKLSTLQKISRMTGAQLLPSVDSLSVSVKANSSVLGSCQTFSSFSIHQYSRLQRTFMCFSGCQSIGCTILISNNNFGETSRIKDILRLLLLVVRDGKVNIDYLTTFRVDPFSLKVHYGASAERHFGFRRRRSFSNKKAMKSVMDRRKQLSSSSSLCYDFSLSESSGSILGTINEAFDLATSGLLKLTPLVTLPDPATKSAMFDRSSSRVYFDSPLFSLIGVSHENRPDLNIKLQEKPPLSFQKCIPRKQLHAFYLTSLVDDFESPNFQRLLTDFKKNGSLNATLDNISVKNSGTGGETGEDKMTWTKPLSFEECQYLHVLVSAFSPASNTSPLHFCYGPTLESWPFYSCPDGSLLQFLEVCFAPANSICSRERCRAINSDHVRRFTSNSGQVDVVVRVLSQPVDSSSSITTWAMCRHCEAVVPMSTAGVELLAKISLARYLQNKFDGIEQTCVPFTKSCCHSFERDYLQFFSKDLMIAVIQYTQIEVLDVAMPKLSISGSSSSTSTDLKVRLQTLTPDGENYREILNSNFEVVERFLTNVQNNLSSLVSSSISSSAIVTRLTAFHSALKAERKTMLRQVQEVEDVLNCRQDSKFTDEVCLNLFAQIYRLWLDWNEQFKSFLQIINPNHSNTEIMGRRSIFDFLSDNDALFKKQLKLPLEPPFPACHHYVLKSSASLAHSVAVFEDEPTSLIAYALATEEYHEKIARLGKFSRSPSSGDGTVTSELSLDDQLFADTEHLRQKLDNSRLHIKVEWSNVPLPKEPSTKFSVAAYHADVFAEIRRLLITIDHGQDSYDESVFISSLSRCKNWKASGGKSGVNYFKTNDGRFIIKQVQKPELQTIIDRAAVYLQHIRSSWHNKRPLALVPILGAFNISFETYGTNRTMKADFIVMEYLFLSHVVSEKFDLKGSQRNRFVKEYSSSRLSEGVNPSLDAELNDDESQRKEIVLLDSNLLIRSLQDPVYIFPHAKKLLLQSIAADTQFLADNLVMDYSLLVGIDYQSRKIVVGIIDYLRTFTWDKKVESVVKASGLLGGGGEGLPTIVAPSVYRERFITAMRHFFLEVPDQWLPYETHNLARR